MYSGFAPPSEEKKHTWMSVLAVKIMRVFLLCQASQNPEKHKHIEPFTMIWEYLRTFPASQICAGHQHIAAYSSSCALSVEVQNPKQLQKQCMHGSPASEWRKRQNIKDLQYYPGIPGYSSISESMENIRIRWRQLFKNVLTFEKYFFLIHWLSENITKLGNTYISYI